MNRYLEGACICKSRTDIFMDDGEFSEVADSVGCGGAGSGSNGGYVGIVGSKY